MQQKFSRVGHILASAGSAIGIANLVILPARAHNYGGLAFILVFVLCTFLLGIPLMIGEIALGKTGQSDAVTAYRKVGGKQWAWAGFFGILTSFFILSFYIVVAAWSLEYFYYYAFNFSQILDKESGPLFGTLIGNQNRVMLFAAFFMLICMAIVAADIKTGIEQSSKFLLPLLLFLIIALIVLIPIAGPEHLVYDNLFRFDFRPIFTFDQQGNLGITEAIGQAFFSLSLGACGMITYASHLRPDVNVVQNARFIVHSDTIVALLAVVLIVPLFPVNQSVGADPSLIFVYLVETFKIFGSFQQGLGILFFALLNIAILTSAVSLLETSVSFLTREYKWPRLWVAPLMAGLIYMLGVPSILSFNAANSTFFTNFLGYGQGEARPSMGFFNFVFDIFGTFAIMLGGLILSFFIIRRWSFGKFFQALKTSTFNPPASYQHYLKFLLTWLIPPMLIALFAIKLYIFLF